MWNIFGLLLAVAVRRHRRRSARLALPLRLFPVENIRPKIAYILKFGQPQKGFPSCLRNEKRA